MRDAAKNLEKLDRPSLVAVACQDLRSLLALLNRMSGAASPISAALARYKLGLEVSLPDSAKKLPRGELALQKQLCRFLIEQGLYAEGTKFGPFESDLVATVRAEATVVEVKVYGSRAPTESSIQANLAQLQDYMDKRPVRPHGILVVYNLSSVLLVAPNRWLRGRYWITVVNLGADTGSKRRKSIVLEEGTGSNLVVSYNSSAVARSGTSTRARK